jgi:hypothetical protein
VNHRNSEVLWINTSCRGILSRIFRHVERAVRPEAKRRAVWKVLRRRRRKRRNNNPLLGQLPAPDNLESAGPRSSYQRKSEGMSELLNSSRAINCPEIVGLSPARRRLNNRTRTPLNESVQQSTDSDAKSKCECGECGFLKPSVCGVSDTSIVVLTPSATQNLWWHSHGIKAN